MENSYRFFENKECQYYPCHKGIENMNCLFCYCPLYSREHCPGKPEFLEKDGRRIKICTNCTFPHQPQNYDKVLKQTFFFLTVFSDIHIIEYVLILLAVVFMTVAIVLLTYHVVLLYIYAIAISSLYFSKN